MSVFRSALLFALLSVASLTACGPGTSPDQGPQPSGEPKRGGVLKVSEGADPPMLDPVISLQHIPRNLSRLLYLRLLRPKVGPDVSPDAFILEGDFAEAWTAINDTTYEFKLRRGIKWQNSPPVNGREVLASDVVFSLDHLKDPKTKSQNAYLLESVTRIEAVDNYTVRLTLKEPYAPLLTYLGTGSAPIVAREIIEKDGDLNTTVVGAGPFRFTAYQRGSKVTVERNPDYFQADQVYLDGIEVAFIRDSGTRLGAFRTGALHVYEPVLAQLDDFKRSMPRDLRSAEGRGSFHRLMFNAKLKPWDDVRVRKAVSLAIDRDDYVKTTVGGHGVWASVIPARFGDFALPQPEVRRLLPFDPDQAKRLLADAGYPNGLKTKLSTSLGAGGTQTPEFSELVILYLKKIGIEAELKMMEHPAFLASWQDHSFEIAVRIPANDDDPNGYTHALYGTGATRNAGQVSDPKLDALLREQQRAPDPNKRRDIFHQIERYMLSEAYWEVPLEQQASTTFWYPQLQGFVPSVNAGYGSFVPTWLQQ